MPVALFRTMRMCNAASRAPQRRLPLEQATCMRAMLQGQLLDGRYRVGRVLSAGGMGRIFSGVDESSGAPVVIKVPQPDEGAHCSNCERLRREARSTAPLESPHLIRFVGSGCLPYGMPFLVLERLEGIDLGALIKANGALSVDLAVSYVRQACLGLAALHEAGFVHRDVKPANLYLCTRGAEGPRIKVIDLGLAKSSFEPSADPSLTGDHMLLGSPSYVSPEQMRQLELDPRTDVWSLGVVLFELLTGTRPFQGPTIVDVCAQILMQSVPRVRERIPEIDPALEAVLQRCLAKDRQDRYGSMLELWDALRPFDRAVATTPAGVGSLEARAERPSSKARGVRSPRVVRWQVALTALLFTLAALWASPSSRSSNELEAKREACASAVLGCGASEPEPLRYARAH